MSQPQPPAPTPSSTPRLRDALAPLLRLAPGRLLAPVALGAAAGVAETVAVAMLVPLLRAAGLPVEPGAARWITGATDAAFAAVGVRPALESVLALYVGVVLVQALASRAFALAGYEAQKETMHELRTRLFRAATEARWLFLARWRGSDLVHALTAETERVGTWVRSLLALSQGGLLGLLYLAFALHVSVPVTAVALSAGGLLVAAQRGVRRRVSRAGHEISDATAGVLAAASEGIGGIKAIKSYRAEERSAARFAERSRHVLELHRRTMRVHSDSRVLFTVGSTLLLALVVWVALEGLALPAATALLLIFLFSRLVPRISTLQQHWHQLVQDAPAVTGVFALLGRLEAEREVAAPGAGDARPAALEREVRLDGVTFAYPGRAPALRGVELVVEARRTTALVGPSGAGKSTVADLLMGLVTPGEGRVAVDGRALEPAWVGSWRGVIGYVAQEATLFHDTVRANLLWGQPNATEAELREALRAAGAEELVDALPLGLETTIGDRGVSLSGGERQRLALARALLRRPALLILDEATSALDAPGERRILDAVARLHGRTTILVITHRLATVRDADVIHVLEGGSIVESGRWEELAHRPGGRFRAMLQVQGSGPGEPVASGDRD